MPQPPALPNLGNLSLRTPAARQANLNAIGKIQEFLPKLMALSEKGADLFGKIGTQQKMVHQFIPQEFNDALKEEWQKLPSRPDGPAALRPVPPALLDSLKEKVDQVRKDSLAMADEFRTLSLDMKEEADKIPRALSGIAKTFMDLHDDLEKQVFNATNMTGLLVYLEQRKRLLPYFVDVADPPQARKDYDRVAKEVDQWFKDHGGLPPAGQLSEGELSSICDRLRQQAGIQNGMLETQLEWLSGMAEQKREYEHLFKDLTKDSSSNAPDGREAILMSSFEPLIRNALSTQSRLAHLSLVKETTGDTSEGKSAELQQMRDINHALFQKTNQFSTGLHDFFTHQIDKHKDEVAIPMIRSYERRANSLAQLYGGIIVMLQQHGLDAHVPDFEKVQQRLLDVTKITREELKKRGVKEEEPALRPTAMPQIQQQLLDQVKKTKKSKKKKTLAVETPPPPSTKGAAGPSSASAAAVPAVKDDGFEEVALLQPAKIDATKLEEIQARKKEVTTLLEQCKQSMKGTEELLHGSLETKIQAYLDKHTVEPDKTTLLKKLEQGLKTAKSNQALLENWGQGMVQQLVKEEVGRIFLHRSLTEQAVQHLAELHNLHQAGNEDTASLDEETRTLKQEHLSLAREIAENPVYPSEATLQILLDQKAATVAKTGEGLPYYWRSGSARGDRGLIDVFQVKLESGKLWAEIHRHYEGNPETKQAYTRSNGEKRVTAVTVKHPEVSMNGRAYIANTLRNEGVQKAVHRTTMTETSLQRALEASAEATN